MSEAQENTETVSVYEEEEEVEISDDEVEATDDQSEEEDVAKVPETPVRKTKKDTPGKVKPSEQVKNMKMSSPESSSKNKAQTLSINKNPFATVGAWTPDMFSQINIVVPTLTGKNESTNELTRSTKPEARYWKAPITFSYGNFTSSTIRIDNVHIPYHNGKGYGSSFVYLCLPPFLGDAFAAAGKTRRPTVATEKSLVPDKNRWWKVVNKVDESFGIVNASTRKFQKKSLEVIFDATGAGITASVVLSFMFKASTESMEPLKPTTTGTIAVILERGFITATDVSVEMPVRIVKNSNKPDPAAVSRDVANDSLMKRLSELGL